MTSGLPALSDRDRDMLEFERLTWRYPAAKETAILDRFEMSATRYYQVLLALIDQPAAEAHDPTLVRRLRRLRDARRAERQGKRQAPHSDASTD